MDFVKNQMELWKGLSSMSIFFGRESDKWFQELACFQLICTYINRWLYTFWIIVLTKSQNMYKYFI